MSDKPEKSEKVVKKTVKKKKRAVKKKKIKSPSQLNVTVSAEQIAMLKQIAFFNRKTLRDICDLAITEFLASFTIERKAKGLSNDVKKRSGLV